MEPNLETTVGLIAAVTSIVAFPLGFLLERKALGTLALGLLTTAASGLCVLGVLLGGTAGLLAAIALVAILGVRLGAGLGGARGAVAFPALWLAFCGSCAMGVWAGGLTGLLTITVPSLVVFWGAMFWISRCLLPLDSTGLWGKAFRSFFGFCLGTNRPFHVFEGRELELRVPGNPFGQFFAGHGLVLTGPAHAPMIWSGLKFLRIAQPGLSFTDRFETVYQTLDLRPQLRSFPVEAVTRDGIRVRMQMHVAFRLRAEDQAPRLGTAFPFEERSVYDAVWGQPVEEGKKRSWDEWVTIATARLARRMLGRHRVDQLTETLHPTERPRETIRRDLLQGLRNELVDSGIEIIDAWFENLRPVDESVIAERTDAWKAEWERRIQITEGEAQAAALMEVEHARIRAQADLISAIGRVVEYQAPIDPDALANLAALRFIEALDDAASHPAVREAVPQDAFETFAHLRRVVRGSGAEAQEA